MAFETLRNTVSFLRENIKERKENRKPEKRNYMKKKQVEETTDPQYRTLIEKAADKKAPFAEKTKGYYRFSREFPGRVDAEGYRINEQTDNKPLTQKGVILLTIAVLFVFSGGYLLTNMLLGISDTPPPAVPSTTEDVSVDGQFGEIGTLPQDIMTGELTDDMLVDPTTDITMQEDAAATQEATTKESETATTFTPQTTEPTTQFIDAPVEDGRFTTQADGWN